MGFLDFIFGKKTPKIENDFFGTMELIHSKEYPHEIYFKCNRHFEPTSKTVDVIIDGDKAGVTQKQIDFFKHIENNYSKICEIVTPLIEQEYRKRINGFKITDFQKEFKAYCLGLPQCQTAPFEWEIHFDNGDLDCAVEMSDFRVKKIHLHGLD